MTSSTKPEVHNVFLSHHIIRTENLVKFGHVFFEIRERTERQTDRQTHAHRDTYHPYRLRSNN